MMYHNIISTNLLSDSILQQQKITSRSRYCFYLNETDAMFCVDRQLRFYFGEQTYRSI